MHQLGTIAVPIAEIAEDLVVLREELTGPELFPALVISSLAFQAHRTCGVLQGNADPKTSDGYLLWVECPCGACFERWVTSADAEADLLRSELLAFEN